MILIVLVHQYNNATHEFAEQADGSLHAVDQDTFWRKELTHWAVPTTLMHAPGFSTMQGQITE